MLSISLAGVVLAVLAGCQNSMQFRVVDKLPAPVFGDEKPLIDPRLTATSNQIVLNNQVNQPASPNGGERRMSSMACPVPAWEQHSTDNAWKYIIIHHSDTDRGSAAAFDQSHRARGWDELGYHFVIGNGRGSGDGQIEVGPRWLKQKHGAHCKTNDNRFNDFGIGICLVGNFERTRPTAAQMASLKTLVTYLAGRYNIPASRILGHGEAVAQLREGRGTACPGKYMDMNAFRREIDVRLTRGPR